MGLPVIDTHRHYSLSLRISILAPPSRKIRCPPTDPKLLRKGKITASEARHKRLMAVAGRAGLSPRPLLPPDLTRGVPAWPQPLRRTPPPGETVGDSGISHCLRPSPSSPFVYAQIASASKGVTYLLILSGISISVECSADPRSPNLTRVRFPLIFSQLFL